MSPKKVQGLVLVVDDVEANRFLAQAFLEMIGWKVAGFFGALVAILASCVPTCLLAFFTTRWLELHRDAPWQKYVQAGLAPITVSLILASGWIITLGAARGPVSIAITIATAVAMLKLSVHPLWWIVAGAIAGLLGWV